MDIESGFRTKPALLKKIKDLSLNTPASEIFVKVTNENEDQYPRNINQIYKIKERSTQALDQQVFEKIPEEFLNLQSMVNDMEDDFTQEYRHKKGCCPSLILYKQEQIEDLKYNCLYENDLIVGIDRTFNLGSLYVTAISYKNRRMVSEKQKTHPIKLGPIFLHKEATEEQYTYFLSSIKQIIAANQVETEVMFDEQVCFGSDQELALTNSIEKVFPNGKRKLCYLHLKENIIHYLRVSSQFIEINFKGQRRIASGTQNPNYSRNIFNRWVPSGN